MTAACPTPESYGPAPLCDASTVPHEPSGTVLAVTGSDYSWLLWFGLVFFALATVYLTIGMVIQGRLISKQQELLERAVFIEPVVSP